MRVDVRGKNVEVTPALREYAEKRLARLTRHLQGLRHAQVTQSVERNTHIVEVQLEGDGVLLRAEERTDDMYSSIDRVTDKLESQAKKWKGRLTRRHGGKAAPAPAEEMPTAAETEEPDEIEIVRSKRFAMKPMTPEDAAMQMELLGHSFYVFRNAATDEVNVIYARRGHGYGLIEPE